MKKFAKSILCLVLALSLVLSFAACGCDKKNEKPADIDEPETEVETNEAKSEEPEEPEEITTDDAVAVVEKYLEAYMDGDFEEVANCYVNPEEILSSLPSPESLLISCGYSEDELTSENIEAVQSVYDDYMASMLSTFDAEVLSAEVDEDGNVIVTVKRSNVDTEDLNAKIEEAVIASPYGSMEGMYAVLEEQVAEMGLTGEDYDKNVQLSYRIAIMTISTSLAPMCETYEEEVELTVVCEDGEWLIAE